MSKKDLTGLRFNSWTVIGFSHRTESDHYYWHCRCVCGKETPRCYSHLVYGRSKSCGCTQPRRENKTQWKGYGEISADFWGKIARRTIATPGRPAREVSVTIKDGWNLYLEQDRKCALTGLDIAFPQNHRGEFTASLDRISSDLGYIHNNIQWVHKDVNIMKNKFDQDYFINICQLISKENHQMKEPQVGDTVQLYRHDNNGPVAAIVTAVRNEGLSLTIFTEGCPGWAGPLGVKHETADASEDSYGYWVWPDEIIYS